MSLYRQYEFADEYVGVLATFGPRYRVVADSNGMYWSFQERRHSSGRWFRRATAQTNRASLARYILSDMRSGYVEKYGITQETVDKALEHLPEVFGAPTLDALIINTPLPNRPPPATSYKTEHDIKEPTART